MDNGRRLVFRGDAKSYVFYQSHPPAAFKNFPYMYVLVRPEVLSGGVIMLAQYTARREQALSTGKLATAN